MSLVSIRLSTLHEGQKVRPAGYFDRVIAVAVKVDEQRVWLDEEVYAQLWREHRGEPLGVRLVSLPRDQWPAGARAMAALAKQGEAGLGDVYLRLIESPTASLWRAWPNRSAPDAGVWAIEPAGSTPASAWRRARLRRRFNRRLSDIRRARKKAT